MKALGDYVHAAGLSFAMYTAESTETCGGYPASKGFETLDAQTFAEWGKYSPYTQFSRPPTLPPA